jgi:hypothetical protein
MLLILSSVGFIPLIPQNVIYIIYPLAFIVFFLHVAISNIKVSANLLIFFLLSAIAALMPVIYTDVEMIKLILVFTLPFLLFTLGSSINISGERLINILKSVYWVNIVVYLVFFFLLPVYAQTDSGGWIVSQSNSLISLLTKRIGGLQGNANIAGAFIGLISIVLISNISSSFKEKAVYFFITAAVLIVFFKSRSAMLAFFISIFVYIFQTYTKKNIFTILIFLILPIMTMLLVLIDRELLDVFFRFESLLNDEHNSLSNRVVVNQDAIRILINEFLLFGGGVTNETRLLEEFGDSRVYVESTYIKVLLERGVVGFSLFMLILYSVIKKYHLRLYSAASLLIIFVLINSILEAVFGMLPLVNFMFLLLGLVINYHKVPENYR